MCCQFRVCLTAGNFLWHALNMSFYTHIESEKKKREDCFGFSLPSHGQNLERATGNIQREAYAQCRRGRSWKYPREVHVTEQLISVLISASQQEIWSWRERLLNFSGEIRKQSTPWSDLIHSSLLSLKTKRSHK